jgi:PhnB protein
MSQYLELIVAPVPNANIAAYRNEVELFLSVWRENGALACIEVEGDDVPAGEVTSFPRSLALKADETVFVALITYRSREHRDEVSGRAMKDPRMAGRDPKSMPFDAKRMYWGGFKPYVGDIASLGALASPVTPYLFFRGRCEEAIGFYREKLGAEVLMMMRFKDNPDQPPPDKVSAALDERIMHAAIRINGATIMMSDGMRSGSLDFECMSLSLTVHDEAAANRLFNALADGGKVQMPIAPTFFSPCFGAVTDKFGVAWMVIVEPVS